MTTACNLKTLEAMSALRRLWGINNLPNDQYAKIPACPQNIHVDNRSISLESTVPRKSGGMDIRHVAVHCLSDSSFCTISDHNGAPIINITPKQFSAARQWLLEHYIPKK